MGFICPVFFVFGEKTKVFNEKEVKIEKITLLRQNNNINTKIYQKLQKIQSVLQNLLKKLQNSYFYAFFSKIYATNHTQIHLA